MVELSQLPKRNGKLEVDERLLPSYVPTWFQLPSRRYDRSQ